MAVAQSRDLARAGRGGQRSKPEPRLPASSRRGRRIAEHFSSPKLGSRVGFDIDLYAQHVSGAGVVDGAWPVDGQVLCAATAPQFSPVIASDGRGGAFVSWEDYRNNAYNSPDYDVYATRVRATGSIVDVPSIDFAVANFVVWPNPFSLGISIAFSLRASTSVRCEVLDVAGREVWASPPASLGPGRHVLRWDGSSNEGTTAGAGVYFLRVRGPGFAEARRVVRVR